MTDLDLITLTAATLSAAYGAGRLRDEEVQEAVEDALKLRHEARRQLGEQRAERFAAPQVRKALTAARDFLRDPAPNPVDGEVALSLILEALRAAR